MNREEALKIRAHRACEDTWDCTICHGADFYIAEGYLEACNQLEPKIRAAEKMAEALIGLFILEAQAFQKGLQEHLSENGEG